MLRRAAAALATSRAMSSPSLRPSQLAVAPATVDLRKGHPMVEELPHAALARACRAAAGDLDASGEGGVPLNYAPSRGVGSHLEALAAWLARRYGSKARSDWLLTTNGVSHGLSLCAGALCEAGDEVVVEAPTYFLAAQIFRDRGLAIRTAPVDAGGLDVDALEAALREGRVAPRAVYVVSRHGNPSGCTLDVSRRARLAALAAEFEFYVLCDDVYHLLDWSRDRLPRLVEFDAAYAAMDPTAPAEDAAYDPAAAASTATASSAGAAGDASRIVSVASFTKILSPGLRLGWIEAAPPVIARLADTGYVVSGGGVAPLASAVATRVIASGDLDAHLDGLCASYAARCDAVLAALDACADVFEPLVRPTGGFFVWVKLRGGLKAADLLDACATDAVFLRGDACDGGGASITGEPIRLDAHIRLCFAMNEADALADGVHRIAKHARALLAVVAVE